MDGAEVAAALLCDVNQCPVCTCPHSELDRLGTDVSYPYRDTESVKRAVSAARSEHLDEDGEVKDQHIQEVFYDIIPDVMSDIISEIISFRWRNWYGSSSTNSDPRMSTLMHIISMLFYQHPRKNSTSS
jgi:hypothetical protein